MTDAVKVSKKNFGCLIVLKHAKERKKYHLPKPVRNCLEAAKIIINYILSDVNEISLSIENFVQFSCLTFFIFL